MRMLPVPPTEARRTVRTFAIASFLHDVGADMIFSVWPLFLKNVLGANMTVIGIIDGLGDAVVSLSQALSGYVSDRLQKRKIFVWMGYLFGGIARIGYAFAPTWGWVIPFRVLDRSGKMRGSPRDALISDVSTRKNRGTHFGVLRAMDNLGAVVGVIVSVILLNRFGLAYRTVFLIAAIPSVLAVALILLLIRERQTSGPLFRGMRMSDINGNLKLYVFLSALFELGSFSYSFLLLAAVDFGFGEGTVPLLYLLFSMTAALVSLPVGRLADRVGRKPLLLTAFLAWALVASCFLLPVRNTAVTIAAFVLYGLSKGALDPVQKTLAAELAPKNYVASTLGGFQLILGFMSLPASFIAGSLWDKYGLGSAFLFSLVLTSLAGFLLLFIRETNEPIPTERTSAESR